MQRIKFKKIENIVDDVYRIIFHRPEGFDWTPGHYVKLRVPHEGSDNRGDTRFFSIANSPTTHPGEIVFIARFGDDISTYKQAMLKLSSVSECYIAEPMGTFVLPEDTSEKLLFVAGGIGITPYLAMAEYLEESSEQRDIRLLYAYRNDDHALFLDTVESVFDVITVDRSRENQNIDKSSLPNLCPDFIDRKIYLSGPEPMLASIYKDLKSLGVEQYQFVLDYFPGYKSI